MNHLSLPNYSLQETDLLHWLALSRAPGIGPKHFALLLNHYGDLATLFRSNKQDLLALKLSDDTISYLLNPDWQKAQADLAWSQQPGNGIISLNDANYPARLREISDAPPLLFVQGNIDLLSSRQIAMVGSRNPSHAGLENAYQFAQQLAAGGLTVTSGLALGIDAASHKGAITTTGATIAVMATGLDTIYPSSHQLLAKQIIETGGTLLSEFPLSVKPLRENFPRRNRIISGLSLGVLVVESALKSGSLITARYANEQGREVFAIPGSIHNPLYRGNHELIRQGAKLVDKLSDIVEELEFCFNGTKNSQLNLNLTKLKLDKQLQNLVNCINDEATPLELLIQRSEITSIPTLTAMLSELEIAGYIRTVPGGFIKIV